MRTSRKTEVTKRKLMQYSATGLAALAIGPSLLSMSRPLNALSLAEIGELQAPNHLGICLPQGFSARIVASAGLRLEKDRWWRRTSYRWHIYPDGGATFPTIDGGWIYVSNSETLSFLGGGASAIHFSANGVVEDAYRILGGTNTNCAGGPTPWGTWLSCEEIDFGKVYECDPHGQQSAQVKPALGYFKHEAVAVDTMFGHLYLTEDEGDGRLYRFVPDGEDSEGNLHLNSGTLQVAMVETQGYVHWIDVPNPNPSLLQTPTRRQVPESTAFNGGEGIWYADGMIYFTTKGDNRVWCLNTNLSHLDIVYDAATSNNPILTGVDNITVSSGGDILVAEDGGDMQIVVIDSQGNIAPLLQVVGQDGSEITGPAFSPDGSRLYFSSQRGNALFGGGSALGITYEVSGPFANYMSV